MNSSTQNIHIPVGNSFTPCVHEKTGEHRPPFELKDGINSLGEDAILSIDLETLHKSKYNGATITKFPLSGSQVKHLSGLIRISMAVPEKHLLSGRKTWAGTI